MVSLHPPWVTMSHLLAAAGGGQDWTQSLFTMVPFVVIFMIFYFVVIRPGKKDRAAREKIIRELKKGDKVVTNGGLYGEVAKVESPQLLVLKLGDNVKVKIQRQAITGLQPSPDSKGS